MLKCDPALAASASFGNWLERKILGPYVGPIKSETVGGTRKSVFINPPGDLAAG
jgi:hypothetical protein